MQTDKMSITKTSHNSMSSIIPLISIYLLLLNPITMSAQAEKDAKDASATAPGVTKPLYQFTSQLFRTLNSNDNIILSPVSIHKALNMVLLGADTNSTTKRELMDTLGYSGLSDGEVRNYHEDYAKILTKFKEITRDTLAKMQEKKPAKEPGEDEDDFRRRLRFEGSEPRTPVLDMFNMVITKNKGQVNPEYKENIEKYFHSSLENVDDNKPESKTKLMDQLNAWGKEAGFDSPIMSNKELKESFEAILVSAIRVQAFWFDEFYEHELEGVFFNQGQKDKPVNGKALSQHDIVSSKYLEFTDEAHANYKHLHKRLNGASSSQDHPALKQLNGLNFHIAEVPLMGDLSFTILEPLEHSTPEDNKLNKLVGQLLAQPQQGNETNNLAKAMQMLDSDEGQNRIDHLTIPKFKFEKEIALNGALQSMGLRRAFDKMSAEISSMTTNKVCIDSVKHQAVIDVNKMGIKAAGVTKIKMVALSAMMLQEPIRVEIKKPFMFMIRYQKIPLFIGQLTSL